MRTIQDMAAALDTGATTARALVETSLARIADPGGEGRRAFLKVDADRARAVADAMDALRRAGRAPGPYAGIPTAFKDLTDLAGEPTPAGSVVLADAAPAKRDAPVAARMFAAGFVGLGRTNMVEFAFGGVGLNPHHGTPASPWDRATAPRVPGGSSSGTAVAVADGMVPVGLGTDTGGSCRIPAACCNIVGWKPTARRVPLTGILPLSASLDSVGPLANTVADCAIVDAIYAGETPRLPEPANLSGLRIGLPQRMVLDGMDTTVAKALERAYAALAIAGARLTEIALDELDEVPAINARGGITMPEAYHWHRKLLAERGDRYDPRVRARLVAGETMPAADYLDALAARADLIARTDRLTAEFDVLALPTLPIVPPTIAEASASDDDYRRINLLMLRNSNWVNMLDRCAIALPCGEPGGPPVSLMLVGHRMQDARLFAIAAAVEELVSGREEPAARRTLLA